MGSDGCEHGPGWSSGRPERRASLRCLPAQHSHPGPHPVFEEPITLAAMKAVKDEVREWLEGCRARWLQGCGRRARRWVAQRRDWRRRRRTLPTHCACTLPLPTGAQELLAAGAGGGEGSLGGRGEAAAAAATSGPRRAAIGSKALRARVLSSSSPPASTTHPSERQTNNLLVGKARELLGAGLLGPGRQPGWRGVWRRRRSSASCRTVPSGGAHPQVPAAHRCCPCSAPLPRGDVQPHHGRDVGAGRASR